MENYFTSISIDVIDDSGVGAVVKTSVFSHDTLSLCEFLKLYERLVFDLALSVEPILLPDELKNKNISRLVGCGYKPPKYKIVGKPKFNLVIRVDYNEECIVEYIDDDKALFTIKYISDIYPEIEKNSAI